MTYTKAHPLLAPLVRRTPLTSPGSTRATWHLELSVEGSGWHHRPGDAIGILAKNQASLVDQTLKALGLSADLLVTDRKTGEQLPAQELLTHRLQIHKGSRRILQLIQESAPALGSRDLLAQLLDPEQHHLLDAYLEGRAVWDLLKAFPSSVDPRRILESLPLLLPRFYSIANSLAHDPHHVHLTVADVSFLAHGHQRHGVCSHFLSEGCSPGCDRIPMFLFPTKHFHLPDDPDHPILMIGPGTGLAPFRAFLQHRIASGASGQNWLFFGERHSNTDFYYQEELLGWRDQGHCRLSLAWSRDQEHKVYVQHLLLEAGAEIWSWIQKGARIYVCGDATAMAKDVQRAFLQIAQQHGGLSPEDASAWLRRYKSEQQYLEDVY